MRRRRNPGPAQCRHCRGKRERYPSREASPVHERIRGTPHPPPATSSGHGLPPPQLSDPVAGGRGNKAAFSERSTPHRKSTRNRGEFAMVNGGSPSAMPGTGLVLVRYPPRSNGQSPLRWHVNTKIPGCRAADSRESGSGIHSVLQKGHGPEIVTGPWRNRGNWTV